MNRGHSSLLVVFLFVIILTSIVSAEQQSLGLFRINECISLEQTCANCTLSNITSVNYPNSSQALGQVVMTKIGTEFNYTFCNTSGEGQYIVSGIGDPDGTITTWIYDFDVTATGIEFTTAKSILYIVFFLILLFLFSLCLYGALVIRWQHNSDEDGHIISMNKLRYVKIFMWFMAYVFLICLSFLAWNIAYGFSSVSLVANIFEFISWTLLSGLLPIFVIFIIVSVVNFITDKKLRKAILRGIPLR